MSRQQTIGLVGSVILFVGSFLPIAKAPIIGDINYFQNGKGDGIITVGIAVIVATLVLLNRNIELLYALGALAFGVICYTFYNIQKAIGLIQQNSSRNMDDNMFKGIADAMTRSIQLEYGWAVLFIGSVMIISAAVMNTAALRKSK